MFIKKPAGQKQTVSGSGSGVYTGKDFSGVTTPAGQAAASASARVSQSAVSSYATASQVRSSGIFEQKIPTVEDMATALHRHVLSAGQMARSERGVSYGDALSSRAELGLPDQVPPALTAYGVYFDECLPERSGEVARDLLGLFRNGLMELRGAISSKKKQAKFGTINPYG